MIIAWYFNWTGTREELTKFVVERKKHWDAVEGVTLKGCYVTTGAWNNVMLMQTDSYDKWMANIRPGWRDKVPLSKVEILIEM